MISREEQRKSLYSSIEKRIKILDSILESPNDYGSDSSRETAKELISFLNVYEAISNNLPRNSRLDQLAIASARLLATTFLSFDKELIF